MYFRALSVVILLLSTQLAFAQGRKPAVEDFVGIEVEHPEATPQGTEILFNFEKDINHFEKNNENFPSKNSSVKSPNEQVPKDVRGPIALIIVICLPITIWFLMMNHLKKRASIESAANIKVLENYRREREEALKSKESIKKVS